MYKTPKIFGELDRIAPLIPTPIYWLDTNYVIMGGNDACLDAIGSNAKSMSEVLIGKTYYDYYPKEIADELTRLVKIVLETKQPTKIEEKIVDVTTGKFRYYETGRAPLFDYDGELVGTICLAMEITDKKEKEHLETENQAHMIRAEEDERFNQIVQQVVHDIRSPIATMQMVLPHCEIHPENVRVTLKQSATRIQDIANQLLHRFKPQNSKNDSVISEPERSPCLISTSILEIISEKRFEYGNLSIDFVSNITPPGYFSFANIDAQSFRRMLSNLINNAVDSLKGKKGKITVHLDALDNKNMIIVEDNGCGMPDTVKNKILNDISVTDGKEDGHGIGFVQIRDTLNNNQGELDIESKPGIGTKIILIFPQVQTPDWIADKIKLRDDDIVVILDDEPSIHGAWDTRFSRIFPGIECKHFENGLAAIAFIEGLSNDDKKRLFLLADYELLKQDMNGLLVISKTKIKRSILVTSHYNNDGIRAKAQKTKTKILPKPLAAEVPITVSKTKHPKYQNNNNISKLKKVDLVLIDDDELIVQSLTQFLLNDKKVDTYHSGIEFLRSAKDYDIDTKFLIDLQFKGEETSGIEIAIKLHELGFNKLYLFSGWDLSGDSSVPYYVNVIEKTDIDAVVNLAES
ncbi:MAG: ATP-binding protein [Neisseriaceae bacterium]